jgi:hypothetical protein
MGNTETKATLGYDKVSRTLVFIFSKVFIYFNSNSKADKLF